MPSVRVPATLDAIAALLAAGRIDAPTRATSLPDAYRLLRTIEHRVQMVDDAQTHLLPRRSRGARQCRAAAWARRRRRTCSICFDPHVERGRRDLRQPRARRARAAVERSGHLERRARRAGFRRRRGRGAARRATGARARRARLRSPAAQQAFEAMLAGAAAGDRRGRPTRITRSTGSSDIVERLSSGVNLFRLLEARPPLARLARQGPCPCARAGRPARRGGPSCSRACSTRRASQCRPRPPIRRAARRARCAGQPYDVALDRVRRLVNERRFALGVQLIDRRRDPLEVDAKAMPGSPKARWSRSATRPADEFEEAHGAFAGRRAGRSSASAGSAAMRSPTRRTSTSSICTRAGGERMSDGRQAAGPERLFQPAREPRHRGAQRADRRRPALRCRHAAAAAKAPRACSSSRSRRSSAISASEAWTWEHMALCRARPVFGSPERGASARGDRSTASCACRAIGAKVAADAAKMRAEMERHKPPRGPLDVKLGPGGLVDLEFAVHVLQLTHACRPRSAARSRARAARRQTLWSRQTLSMR